MSFHMSQLPLPPCARLLGWRFVSWDEDAGEAEIAFEGKPEFANPAGFIQGGFLTAMMDDTMGPAALMKSGGALYTSSIDIHTHFLRPVRPGPITVKARARRANIHLVSCRPPELTARRPQHQP